MSGPNVRVVDALKVEAAAYAASIGVSLNALVAVALRDYLDSRKAKPPAPAPAEPKADGPREASGLAAVPVRNPAIEVTTAPDPKRKAKPKASAAPPTPVMQSVTKVGRNDPCPCGSGRKAKQCHPESC